MKKSLWIGFQERDSEFAEVIADCARAVGVRTRLRSFQRVPTADGLAGTFSLIEEAKIMWLLRADEPNRSWVEKEAAIQGLMRSAPVLIFCIQADGELIGPDGQLILATSQLSAPMGVVRCVYPNADFSRRRLLIIEEVFEIPERAGVALAPRIAPYLLEEGWTGARSVELRKPDGQRIVHAAYTQIIFQTPPPEQIKLSLYLPAASKDDCPAETEVWLVGEEEKQSLGPPRSSQIEKPRQPTRIKKPTI